MVPSQMNALYIPRVWNPDTLIPVRNPFSLLYCNPAHTAGCDRKPGGPATRVDSIIPYVSSCYPTGDLLNVACIPQHIYPQAVKDTFGA